MNSTVSTSGDIFRRIGPNGGGDGPESAPEKAAALIGEVWPRRNARQNFHGKRGDAAGQGFTEAGYLPPFPLDDVKIALIWPAIGEIASAALCDHMFGRTVRLVFRGALPSLYPREDREDRCFGSFLR
jgi:hypothetical protein